MENGMEQKINLNQETLTHKGFSLKFIFVLCT